MHIAIEGLDGVGKTATAKHLAKHLGWTCIEKPLSHLLDPLGGTTNYMRLIPYINEYIHNDMRTLFY